jgi:dTDP-D-glucose 4,6-dehydratase
MKASINRILSIGKVVTEVYADFREGLKKTIEWYKAQKSFGG